MADHNLALMFRSARQVIVTCMRCDRLKAVVTYRSSHPNRSSAPSHTKDVPYLTRVFIIDTDSVVSCRRTIVAPAVVSVVAVTTGIDEQARAVVGTFDSQCVCVSMPWLVVRPYSADIEEDRPRTAMPDNDT